MTLGDRIALLKDGSLVQAKQLRKQQVFIGIRPEGTINT
jgi:ABC-type proline/glycine betaine transport system ATPase subunit